ncbi:hypothetical protein HYH03_001986 [Edaphochlamys debaryana]|uniref:BTB domain-containing protein n=1 Tax=Edaphochlamys debaryana TaxID=47281 RepID=A0A835YCH1_9CHLO|nr:hypothetical protein HYH03_001986 [Edaphochlamys debaryana]|eukprot:KAG2500417.1 hypothetical protein HYH03_001986 [Edaphochlamys debaryana]
MQQPRQGANPAQAVLKAALVGPDEPAGLVTRLLPPPPPSAPGPTPTSASGQNSSQPASSRLQTLVVTYDGDAYELEGAEGPGVQPVALGRHVDLWRVVPAGGRVPAVDDAMEYGWPVAGVSGDGAFFCLEETSIMKVDAEGLVTTVAGSRDVEGDTDGPGPAARFDHPACLTSDGAGALYLACRTRVRRVQLPMGGEGGGNVGAALGTPAAGPGPGAGAGAAAQAGLGPNPGPAAQTGGTSEAAMALVSTLPFTAPDEIAGLAFVHPSPITRPTAGPGPSSSSAPSPTPSPGPSPPAGGGHLLLATRTAVYRANLGAGTGPAALTLLAGAERGDDGPVDGRGAEARFSNIWGLVVDGEGAAYVIDWDRVDVTTAVRRVSYDGTVTTVVSDLEGELERPAVLPNGCLVLCGYAQLVILALDLLPPPLCARPPPAREDPAAGPPRRTLHADMGALLDAQPDGTADLTLVVGDRRFAVHRAILIARCDYFRQRLGGGFADGAEAELSLPDADPAAFELLLRFIYTGSAPIPPALAPAVAELADRLLLPELCSDAQAAVLSGVTAETVVGSLLWAECLGGSFADLFSSLKAWYLEHHEEVLERAEDSVRRLAESPDLVLELMRAMALHSKQQQQQQQQQQQRAA